MGLVILRTDEELPIDGIVIVFHLYSPLTLLVKPKTIKF